MKFFEPIGKALAAAGIKKPNPLNPTHAWALRNAIGPYMKWLIGQKLRFKPRPQLPSMPNELRSHADFATAWLQRSALAIDDVMRKHQLALADRQCRMAYLSQQIQDAVTILCTGLYAARSTDEVIRAAADILCQDLTRKLTGKAPSDRYFRSVTRLGETISEGGFKSISGLKPDEILMPY
jgi:hypothetical protein